MDYIEENIEKHSNVVSPAAENNRRDDGKMRAEIEGLKEQLEEAYR